MIDPVPMVSAESSLTADTAREFPQLRRVASSAAVVLILILPLLRLIGATAHLSTVIGGAALIALTTAMIAGLREARLSRPPPSAHAPTGPVIAQARGSWWAPAALVFVLTAVAVTTWFSPGRAVANGDLTPPDGTAWVERLFSPWTWSGADLGSPSAPYGLPYGLLLAVVHSLGGSAALGQELWYVGLFSGSALACLGLLRSLGLSRPGAVVGGLVYVFNPYVLTEASINPVFAMCLLLLALLPGLLFAAARGLLRVRTVALLFAATMPLVGYAFQNPPLLLMLAAVVVGALLLARPLVGPDGRARAWKALALASPPSLAVAAYLLLPIRFTARGSNSAALSDASSWAFTESRATISNALWLNTTWQWDFGVYFPYASQYQGVLLTTLGFGVPALSAAGAIVTRSRDRPRLVLVSCCLAVTVAIVLLSTGTKQPGAPVFNALYGLPLGWLLREPGRFLMLVALADSVLIGIVIERLTVFAAKRYPTPPRHARIKAGALGGVATLLLVLPSYPLFTGAVTPSHPHDGFPATRVALPAYWSQLAGDLNTDATTGSILVLPPNDFYQMPYDWYYGIDTFIANLVKRRVVNPVSQGYTPSNGQLVRTTADIATALLKHDFAQAGRLMDAVGVQSALVRGDIVHDFPTRNIDSPAALSSALAADPLMTMSRARGPLQVFTRRDVLPSPLRPVATVASDTPDLASLALLAPGTGLVTAGPDPGLPRLDEYSVMGPWSVDSKGRETSIAMLSDWHWSAGVLGGVLHPLESNSTSISHDLAASLPPGTSDMRVRQTASPLQLMLSRPSSLGAACDAAAAAQAPSSYAPADSYKQRFGARSACRVVKIDVGSGDVLLTAKVAHGEGLSSCLLEKLSSQCTMLPMFPKGAEKTQWAISLPSTPGVTSLTLVLRRNLANGPVPAIESFRAQQFAPLPRLFGYGVPVKSSGELLTTTSDTFSTSWEASGRHVLVDGLTNGWLATGAVQPVFSPGRAFRGMQLVSLAGAILVYGGLGLAVVGSLTRRRERQRHDPHSGEQSNMGAGAA